MRTTIILSLISVSVIGCKKDEAEPGATTTPPPKPAAADAAPAKPAAPQVITVEGFQTPESVLWDDQAGAFLVSNIHGKPGDKDDNGYISQVSRAPDAKVTTEKWIDGAKPDVTLHAPKGMALLGDTLYVADIDAVRMFDRKTGAPKGEVAIKGAMFLNDLVAGDGVVYASDSGIDAEFKPTPNQAIYELRDGKAKQLAKGEELGAPNGLAIADGELWVVTFASGELYKLKDGKRDAVEKLPKGALDGIRVGADGTLYVSSWEGQTIFHGKPGSWTAGPTIKSPADFELDAERSLLVVPLFEENRVEMHEVPRKAP